MSAIVAPVLNGLVWLVARWFKALRPKIEICEDRFAGDLGPDERLALLRALRLLSGIKTDQSQA